MAPRLVTLSYACGFAQFFLANFDTVGNIRLGQDCFHPFYRSLLVGHPVIRCLWVLNHSLSLTIDRQKQNASIFFKNKIGKVWCRLEHMLCSRCVLCGMRMPVYFRFTCAAHSVYAHGLRKLGVRAEPVEVGTSDC